MPFWYEAMWLLFAWEVPRLVGRRERRDDFVLFIDLDRALRANIRYRELIEN